MATSIRLLEKTILADGRIKVRFSDQSSMLFFTSDDYDQFVSIDTLDRDIEPIMKRVLMAWSHENQDAVNRQAIFDALEVNRNIMRIRN
jgi:hypothetical protein